MKSFFRQLFAIIFVFFLVFSINKARKIYLFLIEFEKNIEIDIVQQKIQKHNSYKDIDIENITINNFVALKKTFYFLQWEEIEKDNNKTYRRIWSNKFINSKKFIDKTKKNTNYFTLYKSKIILNNILTKNNITIEEKYFDNKISFEPIDIYTETGKTIFFKKDVEIQLEDEEVALTKINNKNDLDEYIETSSNIRKKNDKFVLVEKNILVNSEDAKNPKIGDIKIVYEKFNPTYIIFFNTMHKNNYKPFFDTNIIIFNNFLIQDLDNTFKFICIGIIFLYINILIFMINFILSVLRSDLKKYSLKFIPYFNEYLVYGNKKVQLILLFLISFFIIIDLYLISIILLLFMCYLRKIDYYLI